MTTPPGWEPRTGPTRGDPARRAPRGSVGSARDDPDPRPQRPRGGAAAGGRNWESGPRFTPGRGPGPRYSGPVGPRTPRGGQGRPVPNSDGYDQRGGRPNDFAGTPRSSGEGRAVDRDRPLGGPGSPAQGFNGLRFDGLRPGGIARLLGTLPTWMALLVLAGGAVLGVIVTLIAGQEPGDLLGAFIILGSIAAALAIKSGRVYLLFPAPALTFFVAAALTGKVHDAKLGSSTAGLASGFTQWIAGIFIPAVVATIFVLLIGGPPWGLGRPLITGQAPLPAR